MATDSRDGTGSGTGIDTASSAQPVPRGIAPLLWARLLQVCAGYAGDRPVSILDCGGGSGSLAVPLAAGGGQVTVVDISIDALATLLRRSAEAGVSDRVTAVQGDVEALSESVPSAGFDLVLAHGLIEKLPNQSQVIGQLAGVLRPGGTVSLLIANPVAAVIGRLLTGDVAAALDHFRRDRAASYHLDDAVTACQQAGLIVESIEGIGVFADLVPGAELDRPGARQALDELEAAAAGIAPYRDIAARLHLIARRPPTSSG